MSTEQRQTLDAILRQSAFPAGSDVTEQRRQLRELLSAQPLPAEITVTAAALGGVPTAEITVDGIEPRHVVLYFHGGVYVMGDAALAADLASQVARRASARAISVGYRLAPEHPYPAAVDDALAAYQALLHGGTDPSDIAFAGESAGGGLAIATLVNARDHGLPLPAAAYVMSPYADLTLAGTTMTTKRDADPLLSPESLQARIPDYTAGQDPALALISPIFADLSGLPPLIIQAGTHEVLLDDAIRLAGRAATADVAGHPRHHSRRAARLPGLPPDPRRSSRRTRPSRTAPVGPPRRRRARHRLATGRTGNANDTRTTGAGHERDARLEREDHRGVPSERGPGWRELRGRSDSPGASPRPHKRAGVRHSHDVPPATTPSRTSSTSSPPRQEHLPTPTGTTT